MDVVAMVDEAGVICAGLHGKVEMTGVRALGLASTAVFACSVGDQHALRVGRGLAVALDYERRGSGDEQEDRCDSDLHGDDIFRVIVSELW
jgi:hypothetical protein